ncbi:MAG: DUF4347 domain-containing protein, partial [bacterium]|nr:DUF4347 domain-containing protein [bacterium]
ESFDSSSQPLVINYEQPSTRNITCFIDSNVEDAEQIVSEIPENVRTIVPAQNDINENIAVVDYRTGEIDNIYAHISNLELNPKVLLVSSILEDVDDLVSAAKDNVIVLEYNPETTDLTELTTMVSTALNGREASSVAFATHDYGENKFYLTGSETISLGSTLSDSGQQEFWQNIGGMIQENGRIDLLACNLAAGTNGALLIASLESVAGINF